MVTPVLTLAAIGILGVVFFALGLGDSRMMAATGVPDPNYPAMAAAIEVGSAPLLSGLSPTTGTQNDPRTDASINVVAESGEMFEADLAAHRPRLFVDTSARNMDAHGQFPPPPDPYLQALVERDYAPIAEVAGARLDGLRTP